MNSDKGKEIKRSQYILGKILIRNVGD